MQPQIVVATNERPIGRNVSADLFLEIMALVPPHERTDKARALKADAK